MYKSYLVLGPSRSGKSTWVDSKIPHGSCVRGPTYTTDPEYIDQLLGFIEQHNLKKLSLVYDHCKFHGSFEQTHSQIIKERFGADFQVAEFIVAERAPRALYDLVDHVVTLDSNFMATVNNKECIGL